MDVISAFLSGITYESLIHKLSCLKPRTTCDLLDVATNHASSKEVVGVVFSEVIRPGAYQLKDDNGKVLTNT